MEFSKIGKRDVTFIREMRVVESLTNAEPHPFYRGIKMLSRFLIDLRNDFQMLTDKVHTSGRIIFFKSTDL